MEPTIQEQIDIVCSDYMFRIMDESKLKPMVKNEIECLLHGMLSEQNCSRYFHLIKIDVFFDIANQKLIILPGNLFTLVFINTNKFPPIMFMKDSGEFKSSFEFNGISYSFIFNEQLEEYVPCIKL